MTNDLMAVTTACLADVIYRAAKKIPYGVVVSDEESRRNRMKNTGPRRGDLGNLGYLEGSDVRRLMCHVARREADAVSTHRKKRSDGALS